jgi:hypothetical protein
MQEYGYEMGTYNDHGGAAHQEVRKRILAKLSLFPGDTAEVIIAAYGQSNGGAFAWLSDQLRRLLPLGATSGDPLVMALSVGGDRVAQEISRKLRSIGGFTGSVSIKVWRNESGEFGWNYKPLDSAWDMGRNPQGSYTIGMRRDRGEYWFKAFVSAD